MHSPVAANGPTVLLAHHHFLERGGAENYLLALAPVLAMIGHRVVVSWNDSREFPGWPDPEAGTRVVIERVRYPRERDIRRRLVASLYGRKLRERMRDLCARIAPDIVHVNQAYEGDGLDLVRGGLAWGKARVFGTIHLRVDPPGANRALAFGKRLLLRPFFRKHPYIKICPSARQRAGFEAVYGYGEQLRVVPNAIRLPDPPTPGEAQEIRVMLGAQERVVLTFCGRLTREKGVDLLVDAFLAARGTAPLFLLVVGDGQGREAAQHRLEAAGVPATEYRFTGWVEGVRPFLSATDLLLLPSRFEVMPLTLIEAATMGIPSLSTPFDGIEELLAMGARVERSADMTSAGFAKALAEVIPRLSALREAAEAAMPAARRAFDVSRMAGEVAALYGERQD